MTDKDLLLSQVNPAIHSNLSYAVALQKKAAEIGFDWPHIHGVIDKIAEELQEVSDELRHGADRERLIDELGDLLFACCNLARHLDIDPEQALAQCNQKFLRRFSYVETKVSAQGKTLQDCPLSELDSYWDEAKQREKPD
ncbi:MazG nucleotide pyrophosphohydrolase domain-containing protein [Methylophaga sp. OBS4]|uniref:MazG nucleotide pyrophosphohydrolase domain-containing protein n=1 Tax=Methylophaga sp. OBS4 TaxID=2991935 RepID=UPI00225272F6|nr:MazG nucleotide pyrophosphohydrolase domain-containing protein [Methylophaga sp. OBS4]MCX4186294.1 nucleotide pyrophosphohydrolase [Methylophaga sp. OBS4]